MMANDTSDIDHALAHPDSARDRRIVEVVAEIAGVTHARARALLESIGGMGGLFAIDEGGIIGHDINRTGARRLLAAVRLAREYRVFHSVTNRRVIGHQESIWLLANEWAWLDVDREVFRALSIDIGNRLLGVDVVAIGSVASVQVFPREVFRAAMRRNAAGIIVVHNHPSGDPAPSDADVRLTERLIDVGKVVGIPVIDHVVVAASGYRSIAEMGLISGFDGGRPADEDD